MGFIDLFSALLSHPPDRLLALRHLIPTDVLDTSRTFTLLAGALLLVTAWGLRRGKRRAFVIALFLCALSVPVNLLKAFDFEEATVAAALLFALGVSADEFRVQSRELSAAALRSRALWATLALVAYAVAGSWAIKLLYGYQPSLGRAFADAAYRTFGVGDPVTMVPRHLAPAAQRIVTWYLRSLPVLSLTLVVGMALAALRPAAHRGRQRAATDHVLDLLHQHGDSSVCFFALDDDTDYFFSANRRAVVAYRFESDTLLGIGDPIGPPEEMRPLLTDFAAHCRERDWQFAFFQARPERLPLYRELGLRTLHIGEDPVLWTDRFTLEGGAVGEARRAARKAEGAGLEVRHFFPDCSPLDAADNQGLVDQMRTISHEWLRAHHGGEKGFCMGRFDPDRLRDGWVAAAWNPRLHRLEGFVTWVPIWARRGWALDLIRRRADAASGTTELLVTRSVEAARARGDAMLSLSLSALIQVDPEPGHPGAAGREATDASGRAALAAVPAAAEPDRAREFLMEHLARFYDFKGLFRWKKKFNPSFEDRYLVYPGPLALPRVALALVRAQSPGGLLSYLRGQPWPMRRESRATGTSGNQS